MYSEMDFDDKEGYAEAFGCKTLITYLRHALKNVLNFHFQSALCMKVLTLS